MTGMASQSPSCPGDRPSRVSYAVVGAAMLKEMRKILKSAEAGPTIGLQNVRVFRMPVHGRHDFYDTAGRLHGLIVLVPIGYAFIQMMRGHELGTWFWIFTIATVCFAIFARRAPFLRLNAIGISFPESRSPDYPWDQMVEARARAEDLEIVMTNGLRFEIPFKRMRLRDIKRLKRLIKSQFQAMAEMAKEAAGEAA